MKNWHVNLLLSLFLICTVSCSTPPESTEPLTGPYLGQPLPGDTLELFAPGIISDGLHNRDIAITPDGKEIYTTVSLGKNSYSKILVHKMVDGAWQEPAIASFCTDFGFHDIEPVISADGDKIFFVSNRPDPASGREEENWDIWAADREGSAWGEPYNLGEPVSSGSDEYFPSVTRDGTIYFTRLDGATRENFIYRCRKEDDKYLEAERLDENVNCGRGRFNAFISPDESYIIVPSVGMEDSLGGADYYIVFREEDDTWSDPLNMGKAINSPTGEEWSASLSPDGKYLFFMKSLKNQEFAELPVTAENMRLIGASAQNGDSDVYWISSGIIDKLRQQAIVSIETAKEN